MSGHPVLALGGVGLFLIGMVMLTEGLRGLGGRALRRLLIRFTASPASGALTGAAVTAIIQSSTATTVMAVGFVGAGLLSFTQALGIIFGANLGTTATGWLVALVGFKLDLGEAVMPLVLLGAVMRLMGRGIIALAGGALAGFSLLFVGIELMQVGLAAFEGALTPAHLPGNDLVGRLELVLIGVALTLVTQSSSAALAVALVGIHGGAISFEQGAAMVIGMNVGTTFTALLASIGGATATRRTAVAHLLFNVATGVLALALLGPAMRAVLALVGAADGQIALALFHTLFNAAGLALFLPFTASFARLVESLVPERGPPLTRRLGPGLLGDPDAATDAAVGTVADIARALLTLLAARLRGRPKPGEDPADPRDIAAALEATRAFLDHIVVRVPGGLRAPRIAGALHVVDHLERLHHRLGQEERIRTLRHDARLTRLSRVLCALGEEAASGAEPARSEQRLNRFRRLLRRHHELYRARTLARAAAGEISPEEALARLDAMRWLHRVAYHLWRIRHHLNALEAGGSSAAPGAETRLDVFED